MGFLAKRTPNRVTGWHPGFAQMVSERGPGDIEVRAEVQLSRQPRRADLLLVRRTDKANNNRPARTLLRLWPLIEKVGLVEFKSPSSELRSGDLIKLWSYGFEYLQLHIDELARSDELTLVLVTPSITNTLRIELGFAGCTLEPLGDGYHRIAGGVQCLKTYLVVTGEVAPAENDAYLSIFSHENIDNREAARWFGQWLVQQVSIMGDPAKIDDLDDILHKLYHMLPPEEIRRRIGLEPERLLQGLTPEERLAGLSDDERLAGLSAKERLAGLSIKEFLAGLSDDELKRLAEEIRRRTGGEE